MSFFFLLQLFFFVGFDKINLQFTETDTKIDGGQERGEKSGLVLALFKLFYFFFPLGENITDKERYVRVAYIIHNDLKKRSFVLSKKKLQISVGPYDEKAKYSGEKEKEKLTIITHHVAQWEGGEGGGGFIFKNQVVREIPYFAQIMLFFFSLVVTIPFLGNGACTLCPGSSKKNEVGLNSHCVPLKGSP